MKVTEVSLCAALEVKIDEREFPVYRRCRYDIWENLMGDSWEPVYGPSELEELEIAFWEFMDGASGRMALSDWAKYPALGLERGSEE